KERVKINTTNVRLETIVPQKEETFQVIIDVIKNSTCYKAFTISVEVPKIFMQQFWYTVKKVSSLNSYEFLLANKKCVVDAEVFWKILWSMLKYFGRFLTYVQEFKEDTLLKFQMMRLLLPSSLDLVTKVHYTSIPACMENVDYPELSREDFAFQIDYRQLTKGRRENMPYPRLKFVRIGKDYQEYRLPIPETMLTDGIKQSKSYHMFIKCFTGQIPPKKSIGKGSHRKKTVDTTEETVDVSEESNPEHSEYSEENDDDENIDRVETDEEEEKDDDVTPPKWVAAKYGSRSVTS
ncbi:hypothetical protein Tco_1086081, partial [Tanacetum coccineum]